jgi:hypothetical protein
MLKMLNIFSPFKDYICTIKLRTMQKLLLLLSAALFLLSSCSMQEEIDLSKEGNGHYQVNVDMSTMLEMMKSMGGNEKMPDSIATQVKDTTFSLANMIDSSGGNFTAAEKAYFHNGTMNIKMNMPENKLGVVMTFPVKNAMDLKNFFRVWSEVDSLNKAKKAKQEEAEGSGNEMPNPMAGGGMSGMTDNLPVKPSPYIITDSSIERMEQSKEDVMKDMGEQAQGAAMFMNQINMMTTIKLPRPVKRFEGKNVKLGDDKKSIFFSASMQDMMDDPKAGTFKVIF